MVIKNRVPELLAKKYKKEGKVNLSEVQRDTGLMYATVHAWAHGHVTRADFNIVERWCAYFKVGVGDILVYEEDKA